MRPIPTPPCPAVANVQDQSTSACLAPGRSSGEAAPQGLAESASAVGAVGCQEGDSPAPSGRQHPVQASSREPTATTNTTTTVSTISSDQERRRVRQRIGRSVPPCCVPAGLSHARAKPSRTPTPPRYHKVTTRTSTTTKHASGVACADGRVVAEVRHAEVGVGCDADHTPPPALPLPMFQASSPVRA